MLISITNTPRPYDWGSPTAIPSFLGTPATGEPQAELWLGAHPANPSLINAAQPAYPDLAAWIAAEPQRALGAEGQSQSLPFLLKILAAESPLSLQAHPAAAQAAAGFDAEERAGIPWNAPHRNYKDRFAKPEIIVALQDGFQALSGFRPLEEVQGILSTLRMAATEKGMESLSPLELFETLLATSNPLETTLGVVLGGQYTQAIEELTSMVVRLAGSRVARSSRFAPSFATVRGVARAYPGDPGIVLTLLLNKVTLARGEALFLDAGNIHAYLSGVGIELMGPSDNVMRGGLTSKHVDVDELVRVLDFTPMRPPYLAAEPTGENITSYRPAGTGFALHRMQDEAQLPLAGPAVAIVESGELRLSGALGSSRPQRGEALYLTPDEHYVRTEGHGEVWVATTSDH